MRTPFLAAWRMALASACTVATQWPFSIMCPTSSQWGIPRMLPLYPVERMVRSRTTTAPTCLRSHVARVATWRAMSMKYWSQELLAMVETYPPPADVPPLARVALAHQEEDRLLGADVAVTVAIAHRGQRLVHLLDLAGAEATPLVGEGLEHV